MAARAQRTVVAGIGGGHRILRKHPDEADKFSIDWSIALGTDTISAAVWESTPTGLTLTTLGGEAIAGDVTTIAISGGTLDANYLVQCEVTTADSTTIKSGFTVQVREPL